MSATSHDALSRTPGKPPAIDADAPAVPDPTEDIADEITSELMETAPSGVAPATARAPAAGDLLRDRYLLEAPVGSGGTSVVYRALDLRRDAAHPDGRHVALKVLRPERLGDARAVARLQREFRQTQAAAHPGVVRYHDLDCERGNWFVVMELLSGESLAARLQRAAPHSLAAREACAVAASVADALAHAHARQVVHGDVKPANVFLAEGGAVRLLDFGVAPEPGDAPQPPAGTRVYASPEVLGGSEPVASDDVFSLACVTCEMLAGRHPYGRRGVDAALLAGVTPERPAGIDDELWQVLLGALARSRADRPSMDAFAAALRGRRETPAQRGQAVAAAGTAAAVAPAVVDAAASARGARLLVGGGIAAVLILVLGIVIGRLDRQARPVAELPVPVESAEAAVVAPPQPHPLPSPAPQPPPAAPATEPPPEVATAIAPVTTGVVTFDQSSMVVSNRAVVAAIPLRHRSRAPRDVSVQWRIIEGSARPGRDYGGPESGIESFAAGNSFRILYVPVVANPAATRDRTFVVELTGATPGVEIGGAPRVAVTILGDG